MPLFEAIMFQLYV